MYSIKLTQLEFGRIVPLSKLLLIYMYWYAGFTIFFEIIIFISYWSVKRH